MFSLLLSTFAMMGVKTSAGGSQNIPEIIVGFIMVSVPVNRREV